DPRENDRQDTPRILEFQGSNDGTNFTTLDSRTVDAWTATETKFFEFENETAYEYYRLSFKGGGGPDASNSQFAELGIHERAENQTPFELTASATDGINDGTGFVASDVGRAIRLMGSDGRWR